MTSTLNTTIPATDADLLSTPIRNNFVAAANDINSIETSLAALGNMSTQSQSNVTITGGAIAGNTLNAGTVANSALALMANNTVKGNISGGSASPTDLSRAQLTALVNTFTAGQAGNVPASGGGATLYLNADGSFGTPVGTGGTVTSVSVVSANGFAGIVANPTMTPAITISTSVTGILKGNGTALSAATANTDYLTPPTGIAILKAASGGALANAVAGTDYSAGTSALATGILKSTTSTGALTIAVAADFPTLNQNTTGSAATLTTPRAIYGNNFDGSAALTGIIASTYGGTGNGFSKFSGATTSEKTYTLPDANATLLYAGGALGTPASGVATNLTGTATALNIGGNAATATSATNATTATNLAGGAGGTIPYQTASGATAMLANGTVGQVLQSNGTTTAPSWVAAGSATPAFSALTTGTNSTAAMVVGTGASLAASGSGTIVATSVPAAGIAAGTAGISISGNAATATSATNIAGGAGGSIPYQTAAGATALLANGTAGQVLQSNGTTLAPSWVAAGGSSAFSSITGGTNTTAAMVVGTGASIAPSGSGAITATVTNALKTATTTVDVSASAAPTTGYALIATDSNHATWQALSGGGNALTSNPLSQFAATTSAQLAGVISDETGTGALVFATSPTLVTPALGTPTSGNLANCSFPTLNQNTTGSASSFTGSLAGDVTGTQSATTVGKINGTSLAGLATGILKNTTTTGVPSIAVAADFPTLNQNTTGSAATLTTPRAIYGNNFDGSAALTQIIGSAYGGTGNGFSKLSGATTSEKTYTLPNASCNVLTDNAAVTVAQGGTGKTSTTAYAVQCGGTTTTGALQSIASVGTSGQVLTSNGAGALPTFQAAGGGSSNPKTLAVSTTQVSHTGDLTETILATYTLPANTLPSTGSLKINLFISRSGTAANITYAVRFGGISGTVYINDTILAASGTIRNNSGLCIIWANNSTSAQKGFGNGISTIPYGSSISTAITSSVNTTSNVDIVITGTLGNTGDTIRLEAYSIVMES